MVRSFTMPSSSRPLSVASVSSLSSDSTPSRPGSDGWVGLSSREGAWRVLWGATRALSLFYHNWEFFSFNQNCLWNWCNLNIREQMLIILLLALYDCVSVQPHLVFHPSPHQTHRVLAPTSLRHTLPERPNRRLTSRWALLPVTRVPNGELKTKPTFFSLNSNFYQCLLIKGKIHMEILKLEVFKGGVLVT